MRIGAVPLAVLGAVAVFWSGQAVAKDNVSFMWCDGYGTPSGRNDSIYGAPYSQSAAAGDQGDKACAAALADPHLLDTMWLRRAHIYQYWAFHRLELEDPAGSLAKLDLSDKLLAAHPDPWIDGSIGAANRMVRGVALYRLNRKAEGRAALDAAIGSRPYAASVADAARSIQLQFEDDGATARRLMTRDAPLSPSLIRLMFWLSIYDDDFAGAVRFGSQISFAMPDSHGDWEMTGGISREERAKERATITGALAYARFALGQRDEALAAIATARSQFGGMIGPTDASRQIDDWERAMAVRDKVVGKSYAAASAILRDNDAGHIVPLSDILRQIKPADDAERASLTAALAQIDQAKDAVTRRGLASTLGEVIVALPAPEPRVYRSKIKSADGVPVKGWNNADFTVIPDGSPDSVTIRIGDMEGSRASVEEAALVVAALYAKSHGNDAFVVNWTQLIRRRQTVADLRETTYDAGFEVQVNVRPVASTALPANLEPQRWRLIRADAVLHDLGPTYLADASGK